jgi:hypothetical protein
MGVRTALARNAARLSVAVALSAATAAVTVTSPVTAGAASAPQGRWRVAAAVPAPSGQAELTQVAATSATDAWAAGVTCTAKCARGRLLVSHWDGTRWRPVRLPRSLPAAGYFVASIGASSPRDVWVLAQTPREVTFAVHWDGVSWRRMALPRWFFPRGGSGRDGEGYLRVAAFGPRQVWVFDLFAPVAHPFAAYWDGASWTRRPLPMSALAVSAPSPAALWVIGESGLPAPPGSGRVLTESALHWTGHGWQAVPLPDPVLGGGRQFIPFAAAQGTGPLWVQGTVTAANGPPGPSQLLRWDGHRWTRLAAPVKGLNILGAMAPDGQGGVWLATIGDRFLGRLAHYGHGRWTVTAPPRYAGTRAVVLDLAWLPGTRTVLAAGTTGPPVPTPGVHPAAVILEHRA